MLFFLFYFFIYFYFFCFSAFEDMLENPSTSSFYINDPETGPVLLQVSRIVQGFARWYWIVLLKL